jgi:hypothetical protein
MKLKFIGIVLLGLLLILGLLQIEAIGNLNPIFHSIAVSVRQMVDWVLAAYSPNTIILRGEPELLNVDTVQDYFPNYVQKSTSSQQNKNDAQRNEQTSVKGSMWDFSRDDLSNTRQTSATEESASKRLQLLQEITEPADPVTDLFPETEWYDTVDLDTYDFTELLTTEEPEKGVQPAETLGSDVLQPLLDEIKSQIDQKLEAEDLK